jgi:hypothetical protein
LPRNLKPPHAHVNRAIARVLANDAEVVLMDE